MKLDYVHDLQSVYRKILDALSRPGLIADLSGELSLVDPGLGSNGAFVLLALTLLDGDVAFAVSTGTDGSLARSLSRLTLAAQADIPHADFVFIDAGTSVSEAISAAREGTLLDPHLGATIIVMADSITENGSYLLSGPGIRDEARLGITGAEGWLEARAEKNREYPLGVDLYFVTSEGAFAALPRTTRVTLAGENY